MKKITVAVLTAVLAMAWAVCAQAGEGGNDGVKQGKKGPPEGARRRGPSPEMQQKMLEEFDADGDGKLNDEERKKAGEARHAKMMKEFDKDGDGTLNDEEKKAMRAAMQKRHGGEGRKPGKGKKGEQPAAE